MIEASLLCTLAGSMLATCCFADFGVEYLPLEPVHADVVESNQRGLLA